MTGRFRKVEGCVACSCASQRPFAETSHPGYPTDFWVLVGLEIGSIPGNWKERLCEGHAGLFAVILESGVACDAESAPS